jgi:3-hydroxyacyl-CoA dehydrogenase
MSMSESQALEYVSLAERLAHEIPGINPDTASRKIRSVGIIGAGTMGGGIAMNFINVGIPVTLLESSDEALQRGVGIIRGNYERSMKKGKLTEEQLDERMALISTTLSYADLSDAELVIEAVFENMDIKKAVFAELDKVCKTGAILATNTSTLDVDEIAAVTSRPEDVIGLHFFSPANVMRLLEVVRGGKTADDVIVTCMNMALEIHKVAALVGVCFGFVGNRMFEPYGREMQMLLLEGATPEQIDNALTDFGMAMGPCAVYDLAGIDVAYKVLKERTDLLDDERYSWAFIELYEKGRLGQKSGSGFYSYDAKTREQSSDPEIQAIIKDKAEYFGISQRVISDDEIVARCIYPLINEAALILDEDIASRPSDIDIIWIYGYGFPATKGGPMYYADSIDLEIVLQKIGDFREKHGEQYWTPAPLLEQLVKEGKSFSDLNNK